MIFCRYTPEQKPRVTANGEGLEVSFNEPAFWTARSSVDADLVCLAVATVPDREDATARLFKVPVDGDGWLLEAHQKLRPVDFTNDGVFLCGSAHYPKPLEETITQAQARGGPRRSIISHAATSWMLPAWSATSPTPELCSGCRACLAVCPFGGNWL